MLKILYVCTHNRCRSILCEAITNHLGKGFLIACSAGSHPAEAVHPLSLQHLSALNIPTTGLRSQSWEDFEDFHPDLVITVCDDAAGEVCPAYLSGATKLHWGLADPSRVDGGDEDVNAAFRQTLQTVQDRVTALLDLKVHQLRGDALKRAILNLGASAKLE